MSVLEESPKITPLYSARTKVTDTSLLIVFCQTKSTLSSRLCSNRPRIKVASGRQLGSAPRTGFTGGGLWLFHSRNGEEEQSFGRAETSPFPVFRREISCSAML